MANKILCIFFLIATVSAQATWARATGLVINSCGPQDDKCEEVTEHVVGDDKNWTTGVNYLNWLKDKEFFVGDVIVFNYCPRIHNVVIVDEAGYNACSAEKPLMELNQSVHIALTLSAGGTFGFISSMGQDCQNGMKLLIRVREKNKLT